MSDPIQDLNRRAVQASATLVAKVAPADLARPTPCDGWTLGDLIAHMTAQHRGFAAAAVGDGATRSHWEVAVASSDPVGDHLQAVDAVLDAFASEGVLEARFLLPEIFTEATFAGTDAIGFHFIDYLVHAWDVARSLDVSWAPDDDLAAAALTLTRSIPNGPERLEPGAAFAPAGTPAPDADPFDEVLLLLGRSPAWSARVTAPPVATPSARNG